MYNENPANTPSQTMTEPLMLIAEQTDAKLSIIMSIISDIEYKLNQNKMSELS